MTEKRVTLLGILRASLSTWMVVLASLLVTRLSIGPSLAGLCVDVAVSAAAWTWFVLRQVRAVRWSESHPVEAVPRWPLKAPDAGPGQCPVCGMADLDELARDDRFMERGDRSKVVQYGRQRAHRDCAELVPYVPPPHFSAFEVDGHKTYCACARCEPSATYPGVYSRCRFCGFYRRAASVEAATAYLAKHQETCTGRPRS